MRLPRIPAAVVFDMDGLIFDTETIHLQGIEAVAQIEGFGITRSLALSTIGLPIEMTKRRYVEHLGATFDFEVFWKKVADHFHGLAKTDLRLKPGVLEMLDVLDQHGLPRAICTSSSHASAKHYLTHFDLSHRFHAVIARGDYTHGKPYPEPYLQAAEQLKVAPGLVLALEDSYNGVRSASSAGMMTIMVPDLLPATEEMKQLAWRIATDLHEVSALLQSTIASRVV